jgi:hypothetical protein
MNGVDCPRHYGPLEAYHCMERVQLVGRATALNRVRSRSGDKPLTEHGEVSDSIHEERAEVKRWRGPRAQIRHPEKMLRICRLTLTSSQESSTAAARQVCKIHGTENMESFALQRQTFLAYKKGSLKNGTDLSSRDEMSGGIREAKTPAIGIVL